MAIHYNAFISYRHHPEDIKVADQIHKALERYKIPRSLRKSTGGIERLFRDKEELPITSNLSDDIDQALKNSDFLIVICSTHTRESVWVQREIDLFLSTHDRNHVLTVLVNGEPYEVIPPCLLTEKVVDPVTEEIREVALEPLSCDWRSPNKKIRAQELARLAAPLLGCSYDGLRQRQKHYQTQRRMAAASVALGISLCFLGYFLYSNRLLEDANLQLETANTQLEDANVEIQNNLSKALVNQSVFLASEAQDLLKSGDRMSALALSLEALPRFPGERPYVSDAERVLTDAAGVYSPNEKLGAVTAFQAEAILSRMEVSEDGNVLFAMDQNQKLYAWDTDTFQLLGTLGEDKATRYFFPTRKGNLVIHDNLNEQITCYDSHLKELWTKSYDGSIAFLKESQTILQFAVHEEFTEDFSLELKDMTLSFWDADTGLPQREPALTEMGFASDQYPHFIRDSYDSDQCLIFSCGEDQEDHDILAYLDPQTFVFRKLPLAQKFTGFCTSGLDGTILIMTSQGSDIWNGLYNQILTTSPVHNDIFCIDPETMQIRWKTAVDSDFFSAADTISPIPGSQNFFCLKGNLCSVIEGSTGKILSHADVPGTPLTHTVVEDCAVIILDNGSHSYFDFADGYCNTTRFTDSFLSGSRTNQGIFAYTPLENKIFLYRSFCNRDITPYADKAQTIMSSLVSGNQIAAMAEEALQIIDTDEKTIALTYPLNGYRTQLVDFSGDQKSVWLYTHADKLLQRFDTGAKTTADFPLPEETEDGFLFYEYERFSADNTFLIFCRLEKMSQGSQQALLRYDLKEETYQILPLWELPESTLEDAPHTVLAAHGTHAIVQDLQQKNIYEVDFEKGSCRVIASQAEVSAYASILQNGESYCLSAGKQAQLRKWGEAPWLTLSLKSEAAVSSCIHGENLLLLGDDAVLYRYDLGGNLLSYQDTYIQNNFFFKLTQEKQGIRWFFTEDDRLVLQTFDSVCIFRKEDWKPAGFVPSVLAYLPQRDEFLTRYKVHGGYQLYPIHRYTPEELAEYTRKQLGTVTLTAQQREKYGLSETP